MESDVALQMLRDSTVWFINCDPTTVNIVRRVAQKTATGAFAAGAATTLPPQVVKLIAEGSEKGISRGDKGSDRAFEYVAVFRHDGDVQVDDYWMIDDTYWVVYAVHPDNGYEIKASVRQHAKLPTDG